MARSFSSSELTLASPGSALDITGTALTIACWVYFTSDGVRQCIVSRYDSGTKKLWYLLRKSDNALEAGFYNGSGDESVAGGVPSAGSWAHIAYVKAGTGGGAARLYVNGSQTGSATSSGTITKLGSTALRLGRDGFGNGIGGNGRVAEVGIWAASLSAAEIAALASGASPLQVHPANLKGYWPLWGVGASGDPDLSGNGGHLSETGTVGVVDHAPVGPPFGL